MTKGIDWLSPEPEEQLPPPPMGDDMGDDDNVPARSPSPNKQDWMSGEDNTQSQPKDERELLPGKEANTMETAITGLASDEDELIRYLAQEQHPDEPLDEAVKRYGKKDGVLFHKDGKGKDEKLYRALPEGLTAGTALKQLAESAPDIASATASVATAPWWVTGFGFAAGMLLSGATGSGVEYIRQKAGDLAFGDASTEDVNKGRVFQKGAEGALGHGIGIAGDAYQTRKAVGDIDKYDPSYVAESKSLSTKHKIDLSPAEQTGLRSLGDQQKWLANITQTADDMETWLLKREEQVKAAGNRFLDTISTKVDAEDVGIDVRAAAQKSLSEIKKAMKAAAKPFYEETHAMPVAFTENLQNYMSKPSAQAGLREVYKDVANEVGTPRSLPNFFVQVADDGTFKITKTPSMEEWDLLKQSMDRMLRSKKYRSELTGGLSPAGRRLNNLKNAMVAELDVLTHGKYKAARAKYSEGAESTEHALGSVINLVAKTKDPQLLRAARTIFDPNTRSPKMVMRLRRAIAKEDPLAWQAIKRLYLNDVMDGALKSVEGGEVVNAAGKMAKAFGNRAVRRNMKAAMTRPEWKAFNSLMAIYKRASKVKHLRSDTEFNRLMTKEREASSEPIISKIIGGISNVNPMVGNKWLGAQAIRDWLNISALSKHARASVDLITGGDPRALELMKELRKTTKSEKAFTAGFGQLIARMPMYAYNRFAEFDYEPEE